MAALINIQREVIAQLLAGNDGINVEYMLSDLPNRCNIGSILSAMSSQIGGVYWRFTDPSVVEHYEYVHPHLFLYYLYRIGNFCSPIHLFDIFNPTNPVFIAWHNEYCETWGLDPIAMMECIRIGRYIEYVSSVSTPAICKGSVVVRVLNAFPNTSLYSLERLARGFITHESIVPPHRSYMGN